MALSAPRQASYPPRGDPGVRASSTAQWARALLQSAAVASGDLTVTRRTSFELRAAHRPVLDHSGLEAWDGLLFVECGDGWISGDARAGPPGPERADWVSPLVLIEMPKRLREGPGPRSTPGRGALTPRTGGSIAWLRPSPSHELTTLPGSRSRGAARRAHLLFCATSPFVIVSGMPRAGQRLGAVVRTADAAVAETEPIWLW